MAQYCCPMSAIPASSIGKRVTVRLRDGDGFRDIVGVLQSPSSLTNRQNELIDFSDEVVAIWREIQPPADRAGKGAPLSLRILELEELSNTTWPAHVEEQHGGWLYRKSNGITWRANSVLPWGKAPFGEPETSLEVEVTKVVKYYRSTQNVPAFVIPLPTYAELDAFLDRHGWIANLKGQFLIKDISEEEIANTDVQITDAPSTQWLACQGDEKIKEIMQSYPAKYLEIRQGDDVVATARVATHGSWALLTRLFVKDKYRARGFARTLMMSAEAVAKDCGATKISLQVDAANHAALALYASLGYAVHHEYLYRILP